MGRKTVLSVRVWERERDLAEDEDCTAEIVGVGVMGTSKTHSGKSKRRQYMILPIT